MAAKSKTTAPKGTAKTPKAVAPVKKPAAKSTKKKRAPAKPKITDEMFMAWFYKRDAAQFKALTEEWNNTRLKIRLKKQDGYDEWLNYFKTLPAAHIRILVNTAQDFLSAEAFSALRRWFDIISNPHRIDKIYQAGLTSKPGDKDKKSIAELALANDRLGVLKATRDKIAEKLDKGAGSRDTSLLAREMTEIMTQIADYEKRLGPKADTPLGALFADIDEHVKPRNKESGARNTSFKSRITIDDLEDN